MSEDWSLREIELILEDFPQRVICLYPPKLSSFSIRDFEIRTTQVGELTPIYVTHNEPSFLTSMRKDTMYIGCFSLG